jgi:3-oxoacyl-[acyl-carrier protein] reductase
MFDLTGKTALVTGSSGGIGQAIAQAFIERGAKVVIHGTRREALEALAQQWGSNALVAVANLSDPEQVEGLATQAEALLGGAPDILVNNAGITKDGLVMRMKDEDWQSVLDVNLTAAFRLSRAAIKGMMKRRSGRIINITSVVGVTGNPGQVNYCASKAGMIGMTKAMAMEVASRNITVNCVAPGFISSAMTDALNEDQKTRILTGIPLGRMGAPAEIAASVVYLASEAGSYVTGQTLHVNGGLAMV